MYSSVQDWLLMSGHVINLHATFVCQYVPMYICIYINISIHRAYMNKKVYLFTYPYRSEQWVSALIPTKGICTGLYTSENSTCTHATICTYIRTHVLISPHMILMQYTCFSRTVKLDVLMISIRRMHTDYMRIPTRICSYAGMLPTNCLLFW